MDEHGVRLDWSTVRFPSVDDIQRFLRKAKHSAPGPDGVPYAAWRAAGRFGAEVLHEELTEITISGRGPNDFNISIAIFPAKGDADDDT